MTAEPQIVRTSVVLVVPQESRPSSRWYLRYDMQRRAGSNELYGGELLDFRVGCPECGHVWLRTESVPRLQYQFLTRLCRVCWQPTGQQLWAIAPLAFHALSEYDTSFAPWRLPPELLVRDLEIMIEELKHDQQQQQP